MKLSKMALVAVIACGSYAGNLLAGQTNEIQLVGCADCDCGQPVCGCEPVECCDSGCDSGCESDCCDSGCDSACGGCDSCCSKGCGLGLGLKDRLCNMDLGGDCCLGDPWTLFGERCGYSAGGWVQFGYHTRANSLFNTFQDNFQLQQAWLYAEKAIDTTCGFDIGGRVDYLYGTDGPNTQAFGTGQRGWDNGWDHGSQYGHAIPQLYVEAGYGDLSVKVGHFYTIIGYEVVPATGNFFYSHAYTFNNSEPFTHTGALAQYEASDDVTVWGGYSLGNDSGFDNNGDTFLGGISLGVTDNMTLTYAANGGRLIEPWSGVTAPINQSIRGYQHSIVADINLSDSLNYIFQSDVLASDFADGSNALDTYGINQYLIKTINDCWGVGTRFEWWAPRTGPGGRNHVYALTGGVNYRPHANVIIRPEVRADWDRDRVAGLQGNRASMTTFAFDTIFTF